VVAEAAGVSESTGEGPAVESRREPGKESPRVDAVERGASRVKGKPGRQPPSQKPKFRQRPSIPRRRPPKSLTQRLTIHAARKYPTDELWARLECTSRTRRTVLRHSSSAAWTWTRCWISLGLVISSRDADAGRGYQLMAKCCTAESAHPPKSLGCG